MEKKLTPTSDFTFSPTFFHTPGKGRHKWAKRYRAGRLFSRVRPVEALLPDLFQYDDILGPTVLPLPHPRERARMGVKIPFPPRAESPRTLIVNLAPSQWTRSSHMQPPAFPWIADRSRNIASFFLRGKFHSAVDKNDQRFIARSSFSNREFRALWRGMKSSLR